MIDDAEVGYVKDMEMWELGNMVYLAVATTYKMPKSKVGEGLATFERNIVNVILTDSIVQNGCNCRRNHLGGCW